VGARLGVGPPMAGRGGPDEDEGTTGDEEDAMSTLPGPDAWRDAGLEPADPDVPARLTDEDDPTDGDAEEYRPGFARPDREGAADEADVVEQDIEVPLDDEGDE